jgi:hypothetical protein
LLLGILHSIVLPFSSDYLHPPVLLPALQAPPVLDERPVSTAVRTLLASGFTITGSQRRPRYIIIDCEKPGALGVLCRYAVAVTESEEFTAEEREDVGAHAAYEHRGVAYVAAESGQGHLAWDEFLDALGGAVPSWRALSAEYGVSVLTLAKNELPFGATGEAWRMFEEAVADGLEFVLGRRVQRLGGRRRGMTVSDMIAQMPNLDLLVVDAKAAKAGFDASWAGMRALGEYVLRQVTRQRGQNRVFGALMVSSSFDQDADSLRDLSMRFNAEFRVPVAFLSAEALARMVETLRAAPQLRNAIRWNQVFAGGLVSLAVVDREIGDAEHERYPAGNP